MILYKLLQDVTAIHAVARRFAVSTGVSSAWRRYQETSCYTKRAGQGLEGHQPTSQILPISIQIF